MVIRRENNRVSFNSLKRYSGQWVALSHDKKRIVGHSKILNNALKQANQNGISFPHIVKSPAESITVVIY